jgi:hypothetical protein
MSRILKKIRKLRKKKVRFAKGVDFSDRGMHTHAKSKETKELMKKLTDKGLREDVVYKLMKKFSKEDFIRESKDLKIDLGNTKGKSKKIIAIKFTLGLYKSL